MDSTVTAVIPAYNYARFVSRAVDSVLSQTHVDLKCIVVDDGSTDNTLEILAAYGDRVQVITQTNSGLSAARNTGILNAKSEFVAFLDADDYWHPQKIAKQVLAMKAQPELGAIGTIWQIVDQDLKELFVRVPGKPSESKTENLRGIAQRVIWLGGSGSGVIARKEVFNKVGLFDTNLTAAEDFDMWMRIASEYGVGNLYEQLTTLVWHGTGSFRNAVLMETNQSRVYDKAIAAWPDILTAPYRKKMRAVILADAGGEWAGAGDLGKAASRYFAAARLDPARAKYWNSAFRMAAKCALGQNKRQPGTQS